MKYQIPTASLFLLLPMMLWAQTPATEMPDLERNDEILQSQDTDSTPAPDEAGDAEAEPNAEQGQSATEDQQAEFLGLLDRFEAQSTYKAYMDEKRWTDAAELALRTLDLSVEELGETHMDLVPVLNDLGNSLVRSRRAEEALQYFDRSVNIIKQLDGIFSPELKDPYLGMGHAMQRLGNHSGAVPFFQTAQHITHRNQGVANLDQIPIMNSVSRSMLAQSNFSGARKIQTAMLRIAQTHYGRDNPEVAPAMVRLAKWHKQYGEYREGRFLYHKSLDLRLMHLPADSQHMAPVLKGLALTYYDERGWYWVRGKQIPDDIIGVLIQDPAKTPVADQIQAYVKAGDQLIKFEDVKNAWLCYQQAWNISHNDREYSLDYWSDFFSKPKLLNPGPALEPRFIRYDSESGEAYSDLSFTVGKDGRPRDITVLESNLKSANWKFAAQNFRMAKFRPPLNSGAAIAANDQRYRKYYTGPEISNPQGSLWDLATPAELEVVSADSGLE